MTMHLGQVTPCQYERIKESELKQNPESDRFEKCPYVPVVVTEAFILAIVPQRKAKNIDLLLMDIPAPSKKAKDIQRPTSQEWETAFYVASELIQNETNK